MHLRNKALEVGEPSAVFTEEQLAARVPEMLEQVDAFFRGELKAFPRTRPYWLPLGPRSPSQP